MPQEENLYKLYKYKLPKSGIFFNFKITCFSESTITLDVIFERDISMKMIEKVMRIDSKKGIQFTTIKDNCVTIGFTQSIEIAKNTFKTLLNELDVELEALNQKKAELESELKDFKVIQ